MLLLITALLVLLLDQGIKYLVQTQMAVGQSIPVWPQVFHLTYVENPGAAFGLLANQTTFFIVITCLVIIGIIVFYHRLAHSSRWLRLGLALQLGGAVGNLIDRLRFGFVIDFFDFRIWPVFNIADMAIVTGVALLCLELLRMPTDS